MARSFLMALSAPCQPAQQPGLNGAQAAVGQHGRAHRGQGGVQARGLGRPLQRAGQRCHLDLQREHRLRPGAPAGGHRDEGLALGAPPGLGGQLRVVQPGRPARRVKPLRVGVQPRVRRQRPDKALKPVRPGDQADQLRRGGQQRGRVGHRPMHLVEMATDLGLRRPTGRQGHRQPGQGAAVAVEDRKVFGQGQAEQRGTAPVRRDLGQQAAHLGPVAADRLRPQRLVQCPAQVGRQPVLALDAQRLRVFALGLGRQLRQRRAGVKVGPAQQRLVAIGPEHRQLLAQMA